MMVPGFRHPGPVQPCLAIKNIFVRLKYLNPIPPPHDIIEQDCNDRIVQEF